MTPQHEDLSLDLFASLRVDELAHQVARARDLPVRRQAAALFLLELAAGEHDGDLAGAYDGAPDDVTAALAPVRMSLW